MAFISHFKEVQRLKTQLDQYTDLSEDDKASIEQVLPEDRLRGFRGQYLDTARLLRQQRGDAGGKGSAMDGPADQLDFEFVLFASAVIDYDYIMGLIARYSQKAPGKASMSREELIGLISADAKFMDERDAIAAEVKASDEDLFELYEKLFLSKAGRAIVPLEGNHCSGCHMTVTPATLRDAKVGSRVVSCEQCGRIVYTLPEYA